MDLKGDTRKEQDMRFSCYLGRERGCCQALCGERKIDHRISFFFRRDSSGPPQNTLCYPGVPGSYKNLHVEYDGHSAHTHLLLAFIQLLYYY